MSITALLTDLEAAGIHLFAVGETLRVAIPKGSSLDPFRDRIKAHKRAILSELLKREILAMGAKVGDAFDPDAYAQLWRQRCEARGTPTSILTPEVLLGVKSDELAPRSRSEVTATKPPDGWDGQLCAACRWPEVCTVLGPRGPHLAGGSCPAWPTQDPTPTGDDQPESGTYRDANPEPVEWLPAENGDAPVYDITPHPIPAHCPHPGTCAPFGPCLGARDGNPCEPQPMIAGNDGTTNASVSTGVH